MRYFVPKSARLAASLRLAKARGEPCGSPKALYLSREGGGASHVASEALGCPSAERLQPVLLPTARSLARHGHLTLSNEVEAQLQKVSVSTVRRIVGSVRRQPAPLDRSPRCPAAHPARTSGFPRRHRSRYPLPSRRRGGRPVCLFPVLDRCLQRLGNHSRHLGQQRPGHAVRFPDHRPSLAVIPYSALQSRIADALNTLEEAPSASPSPPPRGRRCGRRPAQFSTNAPNGALMLSARGIHRTTHPLA